jgi:hypothetical protein
MGGTDDPPERDDDQDEDLRAGEEVSKNRWPALTPSSDLLPTLKSKASSCKKILLTQKFLGYSYKSNFTLVRM